MAGNVSAIKFVKAGDFVIPVADIQWVHDDGGGLLSIRMKSGDTASVTGVTLVQALGLLDDVYTEARVEKIQTIP